MIVKVAFAALLALVSAPAVPQTVSPAPVIEKQIKVPVDHAARAKFPNVNAKLIDDLAFINLIVNSAMTYEDDQTHYNTSDLWVMAPADGRGDCEDYALTKLFLVMKYDDAAGDPVDPVTNAKIVGVIVRFKEKGKWQEEGHAILALRLPDHSVMYLDSNNPEPMTRAELVRQGYRFFDWTA